MKQEDYATHVRTFTDEMIATTMAKNPDYSAGSDDAMNNYYEVGEAASIDPLKAWMVFMTKHWTAIKRYVRDGKVSSEPIHGRLIDLATYAMLGDALIKDLAAKKGESSDTDRTEK